MLKTTTCVGANSLSLTTVYQEAVTANNFLRGPDCYFQILGYLWVKQMRYNRLLVSKYASMQVFELSELSYLLRFLF